MTRKQTVYNDLEQVWQEIFLLVDEWKESNFSLGRNLYFHLPLFMDPKWIIKQEDNIILKEYSMCKNFNIPLANTLDEVDSERLEEFELINREITEIEKYMSEKNGR